jgi:hypothetical protein
MAVITQAQIEDLLGTHRAKYDSFDQNTDSWYCTCHGSRQYRNQGEVEKHIAQQIHIKVLEEIARKPDGKQTAL